MESIGKKETSKKIKVPSKKETKDSSKKEKEVPKEEIFKNINEPWFSLIKLKLKKVDANLNKDKFVDIKKNDIIIFQNNDFGFIRSFKIKVSSIHEYDNFSEYLTTEKLEKALPGIDNIEEGLEIYRKNYSREDENRHKIKAIRMIVLK
jgi:ASC-1-like (ASCH) protein